MVVVVPTVQTADVCCEGNVTVQLFGVKINESNAEDTFDPVFDLDPDSGHIGNDVQISGDRIYLRAERSGKSDGMIYTLTYQATDCSGNTAIVSETVIVPLGTLFLMPLTLTFSCRAGHLPFF